VAHVQAEIKKSSVERARLAPAPFLSSNCALFRYSINPSDAEEESWNAELHALIFERIVTQLILRRWAG
jgi:hypothetical protein